MGTSGRRAFMAEVYRITNGECLLTPPASATPSRASQDSLAV